MYLKKDFALDFLALLPLYEVFSVLAPHRPNIRTVYVVKLLRLIRGFGMLNHK